MNILSVPASRLPEYARIPMTVDVHTIFAVHLLDGGLGGIQLFEQPVASYTKNYDDFGGPLTWSSDFDLTNWAFFLAFHDELAVGGAAVAWNTNGVDMLEGRAELSVLWDIRVHPDWRRRGVGKSLFWHAAHWSKTRGCTTMKIETQNINVPACRFYAEQGCTLGDIRRFAYLDAPPVAHEVQLNWYLDLR